MRTKTIDIKKEPFILDQLNLLKPFEKDFRQALTFRGIKPEPKFLYLVVQFYSYYDQFFAEKSNLTDPDNKALYKLFDLAKNFTKSLFSWAKSKGVIIPDTFDPAVLLPLAQQIFGGMNQPPPPPPPKDNTLLYIGLGGGILILILLLKK